MRKALAFIALLVMVALAGCTGSPDPSDASPRPSSTAGAELYVCSVMPQDDRESIPLLAEAKAGARPVGQLPADGMNLGCELGEQGALYLHVVAPRSYIRGKTGVDSGWGSADDVLVLANLDTRVPKVYTGER